MTDRPPASREPHVCDHGFGGRYNSDCTHSAEITKDWRDLISDDRQPDDENAYWEAEQRWLDRP